MERGKGKSPESETDTEKRTTAEEQRSKNSTHGRIREAEQRARLTTARSAHALLRARAPARGQPLEARKRRERRPLGLRFASPWRTTGTTGTRRHRRPARGRETTGIARRQRGLERSASSALEPAPPSASRATPDARAPRRGPRVEKRKERAHPGPQHHHKQTDRSACKGKGWHRSSHPETAAHRHAADRLTQ